MYVHHVVVTTPKTRPAMHTATVSLLETRGTSATIRALHRRWWCRVCVYSGEVICSGILQVSTSSHTRTRWSQFWLHARSCGTQIAYPWRWEHFRKVTCGSGRCLSSRAM